MTEQHFDIYDRLLLAAERELKTIGVSETIRAALKHVASAPARARQIAWLRQGGLEEMTDRARRSEVWR